MSNETTDEAALLARLRLAELPGVYAVGCLEQRITIHDQQLRAACLVRALVRTGQLARSSELCIVGAGFAGVTAAAAAARYGVTVTIIEQESRALSLQERSSRWVHPRLFDWPRPGWDATHGLPFMRWSAGPVSGVAGKLLSEFNSLGCALRSSSTVSAVNAQPEYVEVTWLEHGHALQARKFDACIIAIGFGRETHPGYWEPDTIADDSVIHRTVVGRGDGALIDAARARLDSGTNYFAVVEAIALATPPAVRRQIQALEDAARDLESRKSATHLAPSGAQLQLDIANLLGSGIDRILQNKRATHAVRAIIESALRRNGGVTLLASGPSPYTRAATPLNRWIFALLRSVDPQTRFVDGRFVLSSAGRAQIQAPNGDVRGLDPPDSRVTQRTGPMRPLHTDQARGWLAGPAAAEQARLDGNQAWLATWGPSETEPDCVPTRSGAAFLAVRASLSDNVPELAQRDGECGFGWYAIRPCAPSEGQVEADLTAPIDSAIALARAVLGESPSTVFRLDTTRPPTEVRMYEHGCELVFVASDRDDVSFERVMEPVL